MDLKIGLAQMLCGGVIMDVTNVEQAKIAENAGAVAVMALQDVPAVIRSKGGVARMTDPAIIQDIIKAVDIPVMAKCRIGHFVEAQILEAIGIDYIDESEVLTPADPYLHVDKHKFKTAFVCGARNLGEALRRVYEGAALIRSKGEAGTGDVNEAVRHFRDITRELQELLTIDQSQLQKKSEEYRVPIELLEIVRREGKFPVPIFSAGGVATPADAALMRQLGAEAVFVGSGIFMSDNPPQYAKAIVEATTYYDQPSALLKVSCSLGRPMPGLANISLPKEEKLAVRGL